jgi:predicted RND superfamily exporter protein
MLERTFRFVLRHRVAVVVLCALITVASLLSASRMVIASSIGGLFLGEVPEYAAYLERAELFGNDEAFVVAYEESAPLSPEALQRLESVVETLEAWPDVASVTSLLDAVDIRREDGGMVVEAYADIAREVGAAEALRRLAADPRYAGTVLAEDGGAAAILVEFTVDPLRPVERGPILVGDTLDVLVAAGFDREGLHRAGDPAVIAAVMEESYRSVSRLFPLSALALLGIVLLLFGRLAPAAMAMGIGVITVIWTVGFNSLLTREFSIFAALVPAVILTVAFSDIVHLWSAYLIELRAGKPKEEAIIAVSGEVGSACLLTSATTGIGFLSMATIPTPVSRQLGLVLGFGVVVALLLAVTLVPIAMSWMKTPDFQGNARVHRWLDRVVEGCADLSTRHARSILLVFALLLIPLSVGVSRFNLEADFAKRFSEDHPLNVDQRWFEERFAGASTLEVFVEANEKGGAMNVDFFGRVAALQEEIAALPRVDRVFSVVDVIRAAHGAMTGEFAVPTGRNSIPQHLLLLEMSAPDRTEKMLDRWLDFDRTIMRMQIRTTEHGFLATGKMGLAIEELAQERMGDAATVEVTGLAYLLGSSFNKITEGQRNALILSFVLIALLMSLGLRSLRVGLISMIPNLLPLFVLIAYAGFRWDSTDTDIVIVCVMAIGIGVDDTIHFLMRYRVESARASSRSDALRRTFRFAGRGIVMTTVILSVGFLPFAFSGYFTVQLLGTALPGVLIVALLADLLLVPAMVEVGLLPSPAEA